MVLSINNVFCAADDDKLFDLQSSASFPDALSELSNLQEQPNDRQVHSALEHGAARFCQAGSKSNLTVSFAVRSSWQQLQQLD